MKIKALAIILLCLFSCPAFAQSLAELQRALRSTDRSVQAIHGYPAHVYEGKCHWVPVTAIDLSGDVLSITETWHGPMGVSSTVLRGKYVKGVAQGDWTSGFSSGTWSYTFSVNRGQWNKTKSMVETFNEMYALRFRIVNKTDLRDGPYECN